MMSLACTSSKKKSIDFDEEEQFKKRLKDGEQEKLHLGQKLLC